MRVVLANHNNFINEKTIVEHFLESHAWTQSFSCPSSKSELNPIERVWGQVKVYTRTHTNFTLVRDYKLSPGFSECRPNK